MVFFHLLFRRDGDGQVMEGDFMKLRQGPRRFVIADDEREIAGKFSGLMAVEQVGQAVKVMRDEDGNVLRRSGEGEAPIHLELLGQRREGRVEVGFIAVDVVGGELDTHEEEAKFDVLVLIGIEDVGVALLNEKVGDSGDETFTVWAVDEENGGLGHSAESIKASLLIARRSMFREFPFR